MSAHRSVMASRIRSDPGQDDTVRPAQAALSEETTSLLPSTVSREDPEAASQELPLEFAAVCFLLALVEFATVLVEIPNLEARRYIACRDFYRDDEPMDLIDFRKYHGALDSKCSNIEILKMVAKINGMSSGIRALISVSVVLLYGKLADACGRKFPMLIEIFGRFSSGCWIMFLVHHAGT